MNIRAFLNKKTLSLVNLGLIAIMLFLWMSGSFWYEAWTLRKDTTKLQASIQLENRLLALAKIISGKRTDNYRAFESYQSFKDHALDDSITVQPHTTLFSEASEMLSELQRNSSAKGLAFSGRSDLNERLESLQLEFIKSQKRIDTVYQEVSGRNEEPNQSGISQELYRQKHIQFDSYTKQIYELGNISNSIKSTYPIRKNNPDIIKTRKLRVDIWNMIERGAQIEALINSYISLSSSKSNDASALTDQKVTLRILEGQIRKLSEKYQTSSRNLLLAENVENYPPMLMQNYKNQHILTINQYAPIISNILNDFAGNTESSELVIQWLTINYSKKRLTDKLWVETNQYLSQTAESRKSVANRNLTIDTTLVIFGLLMAFWIIQAIRTIKFQAENDELTALPNRRKFRAELEQFVSHAHATKSKIALLALDTLQFKSLSDTLGQSASDKILKSIAFGLRDIQSESTFVAYLGVGKFAVVLHCDSRDHASELANLVHKEMHSEVNIDGSIFNLDWKMGVSLYPDDAKTVKELQIASDFALLHTATDTTNDTTSDISFYDSELAHKLKYQLEIESELKTALTNHEFVLYYQPQFDLKRNYADRVEALVRWVHPDRGFMPPGEFLPIAEQCGFMPILGEWVLNEAVRQAAQWNSQREQPITVAVNVSADQLSKPGFVSSVLQALESHQLDSRFLEIEITESMLITDVKNITKIIQELRAIGLKISLDDFGTGYSSLSQLYALELDILKIDRSFISRLDSEDKESESIVSTIINIARTYNLEVIAEGAETECQIEALRELKVDYVQGYYYSKPVSGSALFDTLDKINFPNQGDSKAA